VELLVELAQVLGLVPLVQLSLLLQVPLALQSLQAKSLVLTSQSLSLQAQALVLTSQSLFILAQALDPFPQQPFQAIPILALLNSNCLPKPPP
jgi:hypothetical protein